MRALVDRLIEVAVLVGQPVFLPPFEVEIRWQVGQLESVIDHPVEFGTDERRVPVAVLRRDRAKRRKCRKLAFESIVPWVIVRKCLAAGRTDLTFADEVGGIAVAALDVRPDESMEFVARR